MHYPPRRARATLARPPHRCARWAVLLALALAACSSDGPSGSENPVASVDRVVLGAVPEGPVLTGTTLQLSATPVSSTGAALSRPVSWRTSDSTVATVNSSGLVSLVGAGSVTITASCEGKEDGATLDARAGGTLPAGGGTMTLLGGRVVLTTPGGAVDPGVTLLVRPAPAVPPDARTVPGTTYELAPAGLEFRGAATLSLAYDPARVPAGLSENSLQLYTLSNGAWRLARGSRVDAATRRVTGPIYTGGVYTVAGTTASRITLTGPPRGIALYTGRMFAATATAFDVNGDTLRDRSFAWTSSDAAVAIVDSTGRVTGQGAGTATVTAAFGGTQASITLTVLPRPVPSWRQTEEWSTFQGNARHDGRVAATLDPAAFRELWSRTVAGGAALNPVSTGAGKLFVTTHTHAGVQLLLALDALTGTQAWSRDFGPISSVGPPAFGNGRVFVMTGGHDDSFLWSLDAADGDLRFRSPYRNQWSRWKAPVVTPDAVYLGGGYVGGAYRFDAAGGAQSYFVPLPQWDDWTPAVDGGRMFVYGKLGSYNDGGLTVLDAATGMLSFHVDDARLPMAGTPVVGGAGNVLTIAEGALISTSLQARGITWAVQEQFRNTPVVEGGVIYATNGLGVHARRESDGALLWSWTPPEGAAGGEMVLTDNLLFVVVGLSFGRPTTYAVDRASGKHVWFYPTGGRLALSAHGVLFIAADQGELTAVAVR